MNGYLHLLAQLGPLAYWSAVLVAIMTSLCLALLAMRVPRRGFVIASAAALALTVLLVAVPHPPAPVLASALIAIAALAVAVVGGGPAAIVVLAMASRGSVPDGAHGGILVTDRPADATGRSHEVLRGGATIGIFERFATAATIMAGFPEAVAVVVAIKSVGRFSELGEAESRERFIIGTLVSLVWACACGAVFRFMVGQ